MNNNIRWATRLRQFDCDGFIVNVWRPRRFLRWLFPGYWRFRLPDNLFFCLKTAGVKEVWKHLKIYWWAASSFLDPHNYVVWEMPTEMILSRDGGTTWTSYGVEGDFTDFADIAVTDEHCIVGVPERAL